jgi:hypothetical protein
VSAVGGRPENGRVRRSLRLHSGRAPTGCSNPPTQIPPLWFWTIGHFHPWLEGQQCSQPATRNIKRLQGADFGYRLRMGDYRVLFDVKDDIILIQKIGHRKDVYD